MKLVLFALALFIAVFNIYAFDQYQIRPIGSNTSTSLTKYVDISRNNQASVQFNWIGSYTATATFYVSNDISTGPSGASNWVSLDTLAMSGSATASYVKAFTSLPYKNMKIVLSTSATPTVVGIDYIGK